jgi:hypothetical protein
MNDQHRLAVRATDHTCPSMRAALYMRVSTGRQAEHDLSIPDQRSQLKSWCRANGYEVVTEYVEAGSSAGDDRRPGFQQMIERACDGEHAGLRRYFRFPTLLSVLFCENTAATQLGGTHGFHRRRILRSSR